MSKDPIWTRVQNQETILEIEKPRESLLLYYNRDEDRYDLRVTDDSCGLVGGISLSNDDLWNLYNEIGKELVKSRGKE